MNGRQTRGVPRDGPQNAFASRKASATIVSVGFDHPAVGKTEELDTNRFCMPCTRQSLSTTPFAAVALMRVAPIG